MEMTTCEQIDAILKAKNMSRRQLAIKAGIPQSTLQSALTRNKGITTDMLKSIALALDVSIYSIADFDEATKLLEFDINDKMRDYGRRYPYYSRMVQAFNELNDIGAEKAATAVEDLAKVPEYQKRPETAPTETEPPAAEETTTPKP